MATAFFLDNRYNPLSMRCFFFWNDFCRVRKSIICSTIDVYRNAKEMEVGFQTENVNGVLIVEMPESLVADNAKVFKQTTKRLLKTHEKIVLDCSQLRFVDSSGIGAALACLKIVNGRKRGLKLCNIDSQILELFKLMRLDDQFEAHRSRQEAIDAFSE